MSRDVTLLCLNLCSIVDLIFFNQSGSMPFIRLNCTNFLSAICQFLYCDNKKKSDSFGLSNPFDLANFQGVIHRIWIPKNDLPLGFNFRHGELSDCPRLHPWHILTGMCTLSEMSCKSSSHMPWVNTRGEFWTQTGFIVFPYGWFVSGPLLVKKCLLIKRIFLTLIFLNSE